MVPQPVCLENFRVRNQHAVIAFDKEKGLKSKHLNCFLGTVSRSTGWFNDIGFVIYISNNQEIHVLQN